MQNSLRIVFLGTPDFAVASLKAMVDNGYNVVGVVTNPDKPAGRGQQIQQSAVKLAALEYGIPVLQPFKFKDPEFIEQLRALNANVQVVVAFKMLPEVVWNMPEHGTINVHGSLLPQYRGAAPINWSIINGEEVTGVSTFRLLHAIDTGDILFKEEYAMLPNETAGSLHDKLMVLGADALIKTLKALETDSLNPQAQAHIPDDQIKMAPKLFKEHMKLKSSYTVEEAHRWVRGLSPYPAAFAEITNENGELYSMKIYGADFELNTNAIAGQALTDQKTYLKLGFQGGYLVLKDIQMASKKRMDIESVLRGTQFKGELRF